jgi:predicted transcriptional regulator
MATMRVRDIMTPEVQTLEAGSSLPEAAQILTQSRVGGAPVLEGRRIVGVLSKSDLVDPANREADGRTTVGDVMTPLIFAVRPGDPVMLAVRLMALENIHRVIVVNEAGGLEGVVTPMDVMRALARGEQVLDGETERDARELHADPALAVQYVDLRTIEISR